jgi:membrane-associated protein
MHFLELILHLDQYIAQVVSTYHYYFYALLFIVIFCETGLVITPFLPGDSLLFVAGSLAAAGSLNFTILVVAIVSAAFLGDNCNFFIGRFFGTHLFNNPNSKIFRRDILEKTHAFYEHHGRKTIILARFIPLIRTFAPFVAGLGDMPYSRFIGFSLFASILWVVLFLGSGYLFGNLPFIRTHMSIFMLLVAILSIIPIIKMVINEIKAR